jgi:hypothetical protein
VSNEDQVSIADTEKDSGEDIEKINVSAWLDKINKGRDKESPWRTRAKRCIEIYRDDADSSQVNTDADKYRKSSFNILWANTETLLPALFSSVPKPDVRNRSLNQDKVADMAADVIEKSLSYLMDKNKFERHMKAGIKDHLLTGRLVSRVRLEPKFEDQIIQDVDMEGNLIERKEKVQVGHNASIENISYDAFTVDPAETWEEVTWIEFPKMLFKKEYKKYFPGKPLPAVCNGNDQYTTEEKYKVHEVWDKTEKRVFFIAEGISEPLKVMEDPLKFEDFFPIPQPLYSIETSNTLVPIPEYTIYQEQAIELEEISYRITDLVRVCKFIGAYDATQASLASILKARDSQLVAVTSNLIRELGIKGVLDFMDVTPIVRVLQQLYVQRDQIKSIIYEVTGVSDVIRGDTAASETATAQNIKSRWAGLRLRDRRANINRFIVDLLRMQAHLLGRFFSEKQLQEMSGVKLDYSEEPMPPLPMQPMIDPYMQQDDSYMMEYSQQMGKFQEAQMAYQEELAKRQEAQAVMDMIKNDVLCNYSIDIETDSTILADMEAETQKRAMLVSSITQFIATSAPLVQSGAMPMETAKALLMFALQTSKIPRELEDAIDMIGKQQPMAMLPQMGMMGAAQPMPQPPSNSNPIPNITTPTNQQLDAAVLQ